MRRKKREKERKTKEEKNELARKKLKKKQKEEKSKKWQIRVNKESCKSEIDVSIVGTERNEWRELWREPG